MEHSAATVCLIACIVATANATPPETPPIPYLDWGACPGECCVYGDWKAERAATAYSDRSETSPAAFSIAAGERIRAISGVVITTRYGVATLRSAQKLGYSKAGKTNEPELSLQPGDVLYTLHYEGEGQYLFWYRGKTYTDGIGDYRDDDTFVFDVASKPESVWWVKLKSATGKTGWIRGSGGFEYAEACG